MKTLLKTSRKINSALEKFATEHMGTISLTDKAMTGLSIDKIDVDSMYLFETCDNETGDVITQAVISDGVNCYSTCSSIVVSMVDQLIDMVNNGDANVSDIHMSFAYGNTRNGNKCLTCNIM